MRLHASDVEDLSLWIEDAIDARTRYPGQKLEMVARSSGNGIMVTAMLSDDRYRVLAAGTLTLTGEMLRDAIKAHEEWERVQRIKDAREASGRALDMGAV
jgi:hypothetical protein